MALHHAVGGTQEAYDDASNPRLASPSLRVPGSPSASDGGHTPVTEVAAAGTVLVDNDNDPRVDQTATSRTLRPNPIDEYTIWSKNIVRLICITVAFAGLFSPLSSNSYFPALPTIAASLQVSISKVNLTVTIFMIFQGLSPTLWAAVGDVMGRRPVYIATTTLYLCSNIGLSFTYHYWLLLLLRCVQSTGSASVVALSFTYHYWLLLLLRCVQSTGSASVVALGSGTIGDLIPPAWRGGWMSIYNVFTMIGPAIGPVIGGLLANSFDWHAIFYFLAVFSAIVLVLLIVVLPETLRSLVGNGSIPARGINRSWLSTMQERKLQANTNDSSSTLDHNVARTQAKPKTWRDIDLLASVKIIANVDVLCLLTFNSIVYGVFYMVITTTSTIFELNYGLSEAQIGLCYLSNGCGMVAGAMINGPALNRAYAATKRTHDERLRASGIKVPDVIDRSDLGDFPIERARLKSLPGSVAIFVVCSISYGWSLQRIWPLAVPLVLQFFIGTAAMIQFNAITTLLVDLYPLASASATAANNLIRCLVGAAATAIVDPLIQAIGSGWAFTAAGLVIVSVTPLLWIEWEYGQRFRSRRRARLNDKIMAREEQKRKEPEERKVEP